MAERAGLDVQAVEPIGGNIATLCYLQALHLGPIKRLPLGELLHTAAVAPLSLIGLTLDRLSDRLTRGGSTEAIGWTLVATAAG